jgi:hypothetical protein
MFQTMGPSMFQSSHTHSSQTSGRNSVLNPFNKSSSQSNSIVMVPNAKQNDGRKSVHPMMSGNKQGSLSPVNVVQPTRIAYNTHNLLYSVKDYIQEMDNEDQSSYASHSRISQVVGDDLSSFRPSVFSVRNQADLAITKSTNSPPF